MKPSVLNKFILNQLRVYNTTELILLAYHLWLLSLTPLVTEDEVASPERCVMKAGGCKSHRLFLFHSFQLVFYVSWPLFQIKKVVISLFLSCFIYFWNHDLCWFPQASVLLILQVCSGSTSHLSHRLIVKDITTFSFTLFIQSLDMFPCAPLG